MAVAPPTAWWCGCNRPPSAVMALTLAQAEGGRTWSWLLAVVVGHGCWAWLMVSGQPQSTPDRAGDMVVALLGFLPGFFSIPPIDRDEARFAQATKQMVESGEYVDIRFQDEVRYKKPVGIYWLQAGVVKLGEAAGVPRAHTRIWLYRLVSLAGAIGAVLATYWAALGFVSRRAALLAAIM